MSYTNLNGYYLDSDGAQGAQGSQGFQGFQGSQGTTVTTQTLTAASIWTDSITDFNTTPSSFTMTLTKSGNIVYVKIYGFFYTGIGNKGFFYIPWSGINSSFLPSELCMMACPVVNDNITSGGYIYCNILSSRYEIRLNGINSNDTFTGTNGLDQGLGTSFIFNSTSNITFTYQV